MHYSMPHIFNALNSGGKPSGVLAKKVRELREAGQVKDRKNFSMRGVAARLGNMQHSIIAAIETNERNLTLLETVALAKALNVDPQVLFDVAVEQVNQLMDTEYHGK
jgi:transcriptional regulator with XRE-family HTH domain